MAHYTSLMYYLLRTYKTVIKSLFFYFPPPPSTVRTCHARHSSLERATILCFRRRNGVYITFFTRTTMRQRKRLCARARIMHALVRDAYPWSCSPVCFVNTSPTDRNHFWPDSLLTTLSERTVNVCRYATLNPHGCPTRSSHDSSAS